MQKRKHLPCRDQPEEADESDFHVFNEEEVNADQKMQRTFLVNHVCLTAHILT